MPHLEVLESELRNFQIELATEEKLILARYCDELAHWNKKINLTGLRGPEMVRRLVVEPLWIGRELKPKGILADIGSGNGSPGIPLHVLCKFWKTHLVEVRVRRAAFLRHVAATLNLSDVMVHRDRFESIVSELSPVDWITFQGVALTQDLIRRIQDAVSAPTNIVWITSTDANPPVNPSGTLQVPYTRTKVLLFCL